jgi:NhaA family Na+:H+ antiporter
VFSAVAVALGLARLPTGVTWPVLFSGGFLGGIGFTMALFIADLALDAPLLDYAKTGVLSGSALAAVIGSALLLIFLPRRPPVEDDAPKGETA